mmetsp:Transcript_27166/g.65360  ORF Transcript_27166/g.65360 Transcript_27166/m.65360 type:complete len:205 (+) Transcript_27166:1419-2033(+)
METHIHKGFDLGWNSGFLLLAKPELAKTSQTPRVHGAIGRACYNVVQPSCNLVELHVLRAVTLHKATIVDPGADAELTLLVVPRGPHSTIFHQHRCVSPTCCESLHFLAGQAQGYSGSSHDLPVFLMALRAQQVLLEALSYQPLAKLITVLGAHHRSSIALVPLAVLVSSALGQQQTPLIHLPGQCNGVAASTSHQRDRPRERR